MILTNKGRYSISFLLILCDSSDNYVLIFLKPITASNNVSATDGLAVNGPCFPQYSEAVWFNAMR